MTMTGAPRGTSLSDLVAEEIRAMMARRRISGAALARQLGVSPAWVSYRLTGAQPIDLNDLQRIATVLDVDPRELLPRPTALVARHLVPYRTARGVPSGGRRPVRLCASPAA